MMNTEFHTIQITLQYIEVYAKCLKTINLNLNYTLWQLSICSGNIPVTSILLYVTNGNTICLHGTLPKVGLHSPCTTLSLFGSENFLLFSRDIHLPIRSLGGFKHALLRLRVKKKMKQQLKLKTTMHNTLDIFFLEFRRKIKMSFIYLN